MWIDDRPEDTSCTFYSNETEDYMTMRLDNRIAIFQGKSKIMDYICTDVSGQVYNGLLYLTKHDSNRIYCIHLDNLETEEIILKNCKSVILLKGVSHTENVMVLKVFREEEAEYWVYDVKAEKCLCTLPIGNGFIDMALFDDQTGILLCKYEWDTSRYEDDDDYDHIFWIHFSYDNNGEMANTIGAVMLFASYENFDERWIEKRKYDNDMKIPLFDEYLHNYPEEKSISASGKYLVHYCREIKGLIISEFINGNVYRIFTLPDKGYSKEDLYYFNDYTNTLTVINKQTIRQHTVTNTSEEAIEQLNEAYNKCYAAKTNANRNFEFEQKFYKAIDSCQCR